MPEIKEDIVAYCGLCCEDCFGYKGTIADMSRDLRKELRQEKMDVMVKGIPFKVLEHYQQCYDVLGALTRLRCKNGCRGGGGNPFCQMRKCCERKGIAGCWLCKDMATCTKLNTLDTNHGDAHKRNLKKLRESGVVAFLAGKRDWITKPKKV